MSTKYDHEQLRKSARLLFDTPDGKVIWDYLRRQYYDCSIDDARGLGARDVVLNLKRMKGDE